VVYRIDVNCKNGSNMRLTSILLNFFVSPSLTARPNKIGSLLLDFFPGKSNVCEWSCAMSSILGSQLTTLHANKGLASKHGRGNHNLILSQR
jgi:hypothetical protein